MTAEYRKVGRGGAGNYYSQQDIQEASKRAAQQKDIKVQRTTSTVEPNSDDGPAPKYATSGRGGAGNVTDASTLVSATKDTVNVTPALEENKPPEAGHYGRGGAGNYRESISGPSEPEEREMQEMKRAEVVRDVEMGLKSPEKAHLGTEKLTYDTPN